MRTETDEIRDNLKYLTLLARDYPSQAAAASEIISTQALLKLPKGTEHFMSDLHGENEAFVHILNSASGVIREKVDAVLGDTMPEAARAELATLIYYPTEKLPQLKARCTTEDALEQWYTQTLLQLIDICRLVSSKHTRDHVRGCLPSSCGYILDELLHAHFEDHDKDLYYGQIVGSIIENGRADRFIVRLCELIKHLAVDKLHIVGDLFDRGPRPDIILELLMRHHSVDIQWGNHDILWMGAAMGNPACIANALRNSLKYGNFDMLEDGYGLNVRPLALFAMEQYGDDPCTNFLPTHVTDCVAENSDMTAKILKAITVIQFKLEGQLIVRHPEYGMQSRLLLETLVRSDGTVEIGRKEYRINDISLPTVDPADPYRLSEREQQLVDQLVLSFLRSEKLQTHVRYLLEKGAMYRVCNGNLLYHGCIPMEPDGSFTRVKVGDAVCYGKSLMDVCDRLCRTAMYDRRTENTDLLWYLWCGPHSPLNGKDKIATFERTFFDDPEARMERKNPYYDLWNSEETARTILAEFGVPFESGHIINGHVPVRKSKGDTPIKANGKFINIDGGLSKAYQPVTGICGYTLVFSSHELYLAEHQPFDPDTAARESADVLSRTIMIEQYPDRLRVRDTDGGEDVKRRIADLKQLLDAYRSGLIRTPSRME